LGPLVLALGVDGVPSRVLNLLSGDRERDAVAAAGTVLTSNELVRLQARVRRESDRRAAARRPERDEAPVCEVVLLGGLQVIAPHGVVAERDWIKRKARLLFAMLVSRSGTDVARGEIIDYLWPDMDEERGLSNFYVVWSAMKRALSPGGARDQASPFVEHTHGVCRVIAGRVASDLDRFRSALGRAKSAHSGGNTAAELTSLLDAINLYRGDLLPGDLYEDWFTPTRDRFKRDYEDAVLRAGCLHAEAGEPLQGLSLLRDASARSPWREDLYQAILRLQIASGQRGAAIETYLACRNRLVEDLGIDPSRETTALYEEVLGMETNAA
jgi:DNA-binding SARP family transcriptional activator